LEEDSAVLLFEDAIVEESEDAAVVARAD